MFYILLLSGIGFLVAQNVWKGPSPGYVQSYTGEQVFRDGNKHASLNLHNIWTKNRVFYEPKYWRASRTFADQVDQSLGPKELRDRFNINWTHMPNPGEVTPLIDRSYALRI
jgi:hypothetical protein